MAQERNDLEPINITEIKEVDDDLVSDDVELSADGSDETEKIKAKIEETRAELGETIDAIQEKLSFSNISDQVSEQVNYAVETAKEAVYDATIGKAVNFMKNVGDGVTHSGAFRTVKKNPLPLALIGLGTGLLVYQSYGRKNTYRSSSGRSYQDRRLYGGGEAGSFESGRSSAGTTPGRTTEGISDKASAALGSVTSTANSAIDTMKDTVTNAYSGAGDIANRAYSRVGEYGEVVQEKYDEYLQENPLALGALAVAVGAAVGFSIPSTRYEGKLMGEARENLMEKAQEAAGSLVDKAKHVASEAGQTIKEEAQSLTQ